MMSVATPSRAIMWVGLFILAVAALWGLPADAHVRWFTDPNDPALASFPSYTWTDPPVLAWIGIGLMIISAAIFIDGRLPSPPIVPTKIRHDAMELMRVLVGMSLLLTAYGGQVIAPHLDAVGGIGTFLLFLQAFIGLLLISNHRIHIAAGLLIALFLGAAVKYGPMAAVEYISLVGIGLFLLFNHVPNEELRLRLKPYSVDMLRIFTGLGFIALGFGEKLLGAVLGQAFVAQFPWNFMPALGFEWFTDQLFVLSAGAMEVVFGIILVLGVVTRLNTLAIAVVMAISNIVFLIQDENEHALTELVGHMPTIGTAVILLLLGYGQRLKVKNPTLPAPRPVMAPAE